MREGFGYSDEIEVIDGLMETIKGRDGTSFLLRQGGKRGKRFRHTSGTGTRFHTTIRSMVGSELDGFSIGHEDDHVSSVITHTMQLCRSLITVVNM